jgi:hypothetical protein
MTFPHSTIKENVTSIWDSQEEIDKVENWQLQIPREMTSFDRWVETVTLFSNEPLVRVVFIKMIVV